MLSSTDTERYQIIVTDRGNSSVAALHKRAASNDLSKAMDNYRAYCSSLRNSVRGVIIALWDCDDKCAVRYELI
jgi:hypothetical protein